MYKVYSILFKQVKPDSSHGDVSDVLKKLKTHLTETFHQDFPFYLILSYRLHMMYSAYDCDEFKTFIPICISRFETMDPKSIARVMISFVDRFVHVYISIARQSLVSVVL
jgi:hypothetical protein